MSSPEIPNSEIYWLGSRKVCEIGSYRDISRYHLISRNGCELCPCPPWGSFRDATSKKKNVCFHTFKQSFKQLMQKHTDSIRSVHFDSLASFEAPKIIEHLWQVLKLQKLLSTSVAAGRLSLISTSISVSSLFIFRTRTLGQRPQHWQHRLLFHFPEPLPHFSHRESCPWWIFYIFCCSNLLENPQINLNG